MGAGKRLPAYRSEKMPPQRYEQKPAAECQRLQLFYQAKPHKNERGSVLLHKRRRNKKERRKTFGQSFADPGHGLARKGRAACRFSRNLNVNKNNEPFCAAGGVPFESDCAAKEKRFSSFTKNFQFSYLIFPAQVIRIYISTQS